jgi:transcriptional regulator with XRE-family HTH domain
MVNDNFLKIAQFISELRKEKKFTQRELAEQLGVTDKAVSKWERGLSYPDISLLSKLSNVLGVTVSELLNGERTKLAAPEAKAMIEATLRYADSTTKSVIAKSARWKYIAIVSLISLLGILILIACNLAIGEGLTWAVLPLNIIALAWVAVLLGIFVAGKNKTASVLLCSFIIFLTTFYYSSLNQAQTRNISTYGVFNGFKNDYIPHYTIILVMFIISIILVVTSFLIKNKKTSSDKVFLLATTSITIVILSVLTVPAIMDYVDINGLGVNSIFTILSILSFLMNCILLALLTKRHKRQCAENQKEGNN